MKRRIRKYDSLNWVIEEFREGGDKGQGALKGKVSRSKWVIIGYYTSFHAVVRKALDLALGDTWDESQSIARASAVFERAISALEAATESCASNLEKALEARD